MGKMNIMTGKCAAVLREKLHRRLDALSPRARLATVAVMSAAFAAGCLYMTATAIAGFGKGNGTMEIRRMKKPELPQKRICRKRMNIIKKQDVWKRNRKGMRQKRKDR